MGNWLNFFKFVPFPHFHFTITATTPTSAAAALSAPRPATACRIHIAYPHWFRYVTEGLPSAFAPL